MVISQVYFYGPILMHEITSLKISYVCQRIRMSFDSLLDLTGIEMKHSNFF